jgi:glutamate racemase
VGVLATYATFQGAMYASVVERFAQGVTILEDHCPGLVAEIEKGNLNGKETEQILRRALEPMLDKGVDTVVMGCTHYPFVIPLIQKITGPEVRVIDPAPAIARQVLRLLESHNLFSLNQSEKSIRFLTSGDTIQFAKSLPYFSFESTSVEKVEWQDNTLSLKESK